jgi:YHS domain-containing protein/thiol-disulfide isomerase/thioredoxin
MPAMAADGDVWMTNYEAARAKSKQQGKPLVIHFHAKWCGPCKQMDREVLNRPAVVDVLKKRFIAVKVDHDLHPELIRKFGIASLPSDVVYDPIYDRAVVRLTGPSDTNGYVTGIVRGETRMLAAHRGRIVRTEDENTTRRFPGSGEPDSELTDNSGTTNGQDQSPSGPMLGLGGFSAVALYDRREWKKGSEDFTAEHAGVKYHFLSADEVREFRDDPEKYVPRMLGCDPVLLKEKDRLIAGTTKFAAYFDDELYLFSSAETRTRFKNQPRQFRDTQHVLWTDEIEPATVIR